MLPNFLIIGAGKSGTTTLHNVLQQHPEIYMSSIKEPNFFALEGQTKINGYDKDDPHGFFHYPWAVTNMEDYQNLFKDAKDEIAIGESSTMYQYMPLVPQRIKQHAPNMKIIGIFRNPADRLYSRYLHLVREDRAPSEKFKDCLNKSSIWWQKNDLIQEGFYYKHMHRYFELFPKNQLKILLYDDFKADPNTFMKDIFTFLDVDSSFEPNLNIHYNISGKIKNKFIDRFIGQKSLLKKWIGRTSPILLEQLKRSFKVQNLVSKLRSKNLERPPIDQSVRQQLLQEVYTQDIKAFQDLIQRDLSHWVVH
ncbi:MAG: sulfotransferase [Aureispira sp.]|nr:sulfotransferase [Aureispira sp.]